MSQLLAGGVPGQGDLGCPRLPTAQTYALTDRVSLGHYLDHVRVPTFLIQGQDDTLSNLQEAIATYRGLKAGKVPVSMAWQSWGPRRHER